MNTLAEILPGLPSVFDGDVEAFRQAIDMWPVGLLVVDAHANVVVANQSIHNTCLSHPCEGRRLSALVHRGDRELLSDALTKAITTDGGVSVALRFLRPGGASTAMDTLVTARRTTLGSPVHFTIVLSDIRDAALPHAGTPGAPPDDSLDKAQARWQELEQSEKKYRQIFTHESDASVLFDDATLKVIDANPAALQMYGYEFDEITSRTVIDLSGQPELTRETLDRSRSGTKILLPERWVKNRDGETFPAEIVVSSFVLNGRRVWVSIDRDVTERMLASDALRASESRFRDFASVAADWFWEMDEDFRFTYQSARFSEITGISIDDVIGKTRREAFGPYIDDHEHWAAQYEDMLARRPYRLVWSVVGAARELRHLETIGHPKFDAENRFRGYRGVGRDITEARRSQQRLEALVTALEGKNAELEQFVYTVSHDLKSPLLTIKSFLGLLETDIEANNRERIDADLNHIRRATERMQVLLRDLLELSRIGWVASEFEWVSLHDVSVEVTEQLRARIDMNDVEIKIADNLPKVFADRLRLSQVIQNLVENGIKFAGRSREALVEIGCKKCETHDVLYVRDNGPGVAPRFHDRVFRLFERLESDDDGTGVGLALVRRIVEDHGGNIWIDSSGTGDGACFCFTLAGRTALATEDEGESVALQNRPSSA